MQLLISQWPCAAKWSEFHLKVLISQWQCAAKGSRFNIQLLISLWPCAAKGSRFNHELVLSMTMCFQMVKIQLSSIVAEYLLCNRSWVNCKLHDLYNQLDRVKRIWYWSSMRAAKVQASLRIRAVSPEPSLLAHTSSESRGTFRQKARSLAPLNGWACAVEICHDRMLEDTNSLDGAQLISQRVKISWGLF